MMPALRDRTIVEDFNFPVSRHSARISQKKTTIDGVLSKGSLGRSASLRVSKREIVEYAKQTNESPKVQTPRSARIRNKKKSSKNDDENLPPCKSPGKRSHRNIDNTKKFQSLENLSTNNKPVPCSPPKKTKDNNNQDSVKSVPSKQTPPQSPTLSFSPVKSPVDDRVISFYPSPKSGAVRSLFSDPKDSKRVSSLHRSPLPSPRVSAVMNEDPSIKPDALCRSLFKSPLKAPLKSPLKSPRKTVHPRTTTQREDVRQSPRKLDYSSPLRLVRQHCACYQQTKQVLHTGLPERVVGREDEQKTVNDFLKALIPKKRSGSLYISGAPGTGKTAVVSNMLKSIKDEKKKSKCKVAYVNCMGLRNAQTIYNKVLTELTTKDSSLTQKEAITEIEKLLSAPGIPIVLVLDEMDQLDSKNQEVLYTMFEWPSFKKSRLVLIGIANALDLTDRILPRLQARPKCKPQLLHFDPYTKEQIVNVLKDRLEKIKLESGTIVFDNMAVQFVARKISAITGDMRKALDICRRAVEIVEQDVRKQQILKPTTVYNSPNKLSAMVPKNVTIAHVAKVVNEVYGSGATGATPGQTIPLQQKLTICTLLLIMKRNKVKETTIGKLHEAYAKICRRQEVIAVDQSEFISLCSHLQDKGIFAIKKIKDGRNAKVTLKLDQNEVEHALQDKTLISAILLHGLS